MPLGTVLYLCILNYKLLMNSKFYSSFNILSQYKYMENNHFVNLIILCNRTSVDVKKISLLQTTMVHFQKTIKLLLKWSAVYYTVMMKFLIIGF